MNSQSPNRHIRQNSKGSAIITVVVSMLFVMALGAALLFATYTGYKITISERSDKANFYSASSAMDDIRAGIQTKLTESIAKAYTDVLVEYTNTHATGYDTQTDFNDKIIAQLLSKRVTTSTSANIDLFISGTKNGKTVITGYNANALETFINPTAPGTAAITGGTISEISSSDGVLTSISLKSISLKYVNNGYESDITTDITILMPFFFDSASVSSGINNYAIIANNGLTESGAGNKIDGSVFVGSAGITVSGTGNSLALTNGDVISKGPISVDKSAALTFDASAKELWASEIKLGASGMNGTPGSADLRGNVYVANDLILDGKGSSATLNNSYFGFGSSATDPKSSSSILVNSTNCTLDISKLDKLTLAGVSFIDTNGELSDFGNAPFGSPITMGESMSVKSDQLAYLVPVKCISNYPSNPCVFDKAATIAPTIDMNTVLWGTKKLSDYIGVSGIKTLYKSLDATNNIVYVFMVFSDRTYANAYFKDYFAADPSKIQQYLSLYLTSLSDKADNAQINTAGNTFYMDDNSTASTADDKLTLQPASQSVYASGYQTRYSNLKSPYAAYVNTTELAKIGSSPPLEFKNTAGETVAIVSKDCTFNDNYPNTVRLIISSNNVTIDKAFNGIIIAGNNITIKKNVAASILDVSLLDATCTTANGTIHKLSDFIGSSALFGQTTTTTKDSWDLDSLVFYDNWTKH